MTNLFRSALAALPAVMLLCTFGGEAGAAAPKVTTEKVGAWQLVCGGGKEARTCRAKQTTNATGTKQTVLGWSIGYGKDGTIVSNVFVPNGVMLGAGLNVKWPSGANQRLDYRVCEKASGCSAELPIPPELLTGKLGKKKVEFTFYNLSKQAFVYSLSLNGFDKVLAKMKP